MGRCEQDERKERFHIAAPGKNKTSTCKRLAEKQQGKMSRHTDGWIDLD